MEKKSFSQKIIGFLWQTTLTDDIQKNTDIYLKTTIREIITYAIFVFVITFICIGMIGTNMYYYSFLMRNLFVYDTNAALKLVNINTNEKFWNYMTNKFVENAYWETWYNGQKVKPSEGYIIHQNKLLGLIRMRQLRVRNNSCTVSSYFRDSIPFCYDTYSKEVEDKAPFGPANSTAWIYHEESELTANSFSGYVNTYGGGGYYQLLPTKKNETLAVLAKLMKNMWIDRGTRLILLEFTAYNANINMFSIVRIGFEFPSTGSIITTPDIATVKFIRYASTFDYVVMGFEVLFVCFIIYYIIEEIMEINNLRKAYFKKFWNFIDVCIIILSLLCIAFNIYRSFVVSNDLNIAIADTRNFNDLSWLSYWQTLFDKMIAITAFVSWIKIFKYVGFNRTLSYLSKTISNSSTDLVGFAIMFFIVFLAFAQLGYLLFGSEIKDFRNYESCIYTLFRIILGDFNFQQLQQADEYLGPAYFILYIFFVFFVLINMFLAIINDSYTDVKGNIDSKDMYISSFITDRLKQISQKHKKLTASEIKDFINNKNKINLIKWNQSLKSRGFNEDEVMNIISDYSMSYKNIDMTFDEKKEIMVSLERKHIKHKDSDSSITLKEDSKKIANEMQKLKDRIEVLEGTNICIEKMSKYMQYIFEKFSKLEKFKMINRNKTNIVLDRMISKYKDLDDS
ncbi:Polycystin-2 [Intoshia linei]|uniref:Polycystin-2 n=1 Tax=Intoshia linei TaxID=1819745 RepID=A0A177B718_9BILA|nr:Polycystin-2 [Intoshia linei]